MITFIFLLTNILSGYFSWWWLVATMAIDVFFYSARSIAYYFDDLQKAEDDGLGPH